MAAKLRHLGKAKIDFPALRGMERSEHHCPSNQDTGHSAEAPLLWCTTSADSRPGRDTETFARETHFEKMHQGTGFRPFPGYGAAEK